jgi:hypothetical protein
VLCLVIQAVEIGQVGLSAEPITADGYGVIMAVVAAVAVPIALGSIYLIIKDLREARKLEAPGAATDATVTEEAHDVVCDSLVELCGNPVQIRNPFRKSARSDVSSFRASEPDGADVHLSETLLSDATVTEEARPDLRPETFGQEFVVAGARRAAPPRPVPARPTAQPQQVRPADHILRLFCARELSSATILL